MRPIDITFNCAILTMAVILFPGGYRVSDTAPQTYEELKEAFDANKPIVWSGASENTIYACPEVNWAFRAWHDWCHWKGQHPFTSAGEYAVFQMQCEHLELVYGKSADTDRWSAILYAEVIGQLRYEQQHGHFPKDQREFVLSFLAPQQEAAE